jgi:hypothetical protein
MNKLNLKNINLQAPYTVHEREDKQHEFYFWSDFGIVYTQLEPTLLCNYLKIQAIAKCQLK